jgi:hypothetical protein
LSTLLSQGWEVHHYGPAMGPNGVLEHCFHLRRQRENKVLSIRKKFFGRGYDVHELEV